MSIKVAEIGQPFRIDASFDMSGSTGLEIKFTDPSGTEFTYTQATTPAVTAPADALTNDPELGNVPASEYFEITTDVDMFETAGTWYACGRYLDGTKDLYADEVEFIIKEQCSAA